MKSQILRALETVGGAIMRIVFSRKFLAFVGVLIVAWKAFAICIASENPFAWIFFGVVGLILTLALAVYVWSNVRAKTAIIPPVEPPEI